MTRVRLALTFAAGLIAGGALMWSYLNAPVRVAALADNCDDPIEVRPSVPPPSPVITTIKPPDITPPAEPDAIAELRARRLTLPVKGLDSSELRSSFDEVRGQGRRHKAIDILAPRNTPVLAVEDGIVAKLFTSKAGGLTVYLFDPSSTYAYYYAHLEKYADGLAERARVRRGEVLGYVGTSGNAPESTPHLHFTIFRLTDKKEWWQGAPIDPYSVLR